MSKKYSKRNKQKEKKQKKKPPTTQTVQQVSKKPNLELGVTKLVKRSKTKEEQITKSQKKKIFFNLLCSPHLPIVISNVNESNESSQFCKYCKLIKLNSTDNKKNPEVTNKMLGK